MFRVLINFGVIVALAVATGRPALAADEPTSEIVVTSHRQEQAVLHHAGNIEVLDARLINDVLHQHIHELMTRVPGVWITRASGQEHLTAIRSPVLTGPGSCGGFLFLEDGVPIRPAGFCNVNQLFEINTEQARSIEVLRGPGNALYGSNALHGTINVLMPGPGGRAPSYASLEVGANDFIRLRGELPLDSDSPFFAGLVFADDGGFREESGYRQAKVHLKAKADLFGGSLTSAFSATDLDQETAGFILGEDAYKDPDLNRGNLNPEAFRDASSQRLYGIWSRAGDGFTVEVRPYLRNSDMTFLQHFLPGQPLEENGHVSAGAISSITFDTRRQTTIVGADIEWSDVFLRQTQFGSTEGSDFLQETRPAGKHYDYEVSSFNIAPYFQTEVRLGENLQFGVGLRAEYVRYDYDNLMLTGNTRDDGTPCGFGGCLYTRPADRADSFVNFAPKFSVGYAIDPASTAYLSILRGFRAPQMTELYRLQDGQEVADLDSERVNSVEIGLRRITNSLTFDVTVFAMRKRNSVFRDAQGFNVSGARTRHDGIEAAVDWQLHANWLVNVNATYARHRYDFDSVAARGETFVSGRDVDTAPRWMSSTEITYDAGGRLWTGLQWVVMGSYYLDAENRFEYSGHSLFNLKAGIDLSGQLSVTARLNNVTDEYYADRADYAFGNYRYFPGRGREFFIELRYSTNSSP